MSHWSDPKWIKDEVARKWASGRILRYLLKDDGLFPIRIPLKRPQNSDLNERFVEVSQWIELLKEKSKKINSLGYELEEKEFNHRLLGRNQLPTHAIIPTVDDALYLLKKQNEAARFRHLAKEILAKWPVLHEWIEKYPHKVLTAGEQWDGILAVLKWFSEHPSGGLYLRQVDICGIDTKFIEKRKNLLQELLDIILPEDAIVKTAGSFEKRYGLKEKPKQIRLRFLDPEQYLHGISDIAVPVEQLAQFDLPSSRIFITENEINGLCFPEVKDSVVIFGLGYGIDLLKSVPWLRTRRIYYWGDIDTHGLAMLDQVRSFLPQTKSMLMNENVLLAHQELWSIESKPFIGRLTRLTAEEQMVFCQLQDNIWGKGVRLEQERIAFGQVQKAIQMILD
ncbi:DUF3322 domain-containing protein [Heliophilum fasciatum]|uniref:Wadjet protein JetD C-terminal domain-containing protein n=1 Tax=Heliophilum fasciatum TaxID=35700 RepID=A0A4R2RYC2_9FIRM|nr:DUF3322 domain-containing protein [Heliophilum fasciatum]MCW2276950.1 hypothetical protein [Heliophilum fasciatum]TCP68524.1 hypothetical protein EDD73_103158 [Heliophilum fasciatum]